MDAILKIALRFKGALDDASDAPIVLVAKIFPFWYKRYDPPAIKLLAISFLIVFSKESIAATAVSDFKSLTGLFVFFCAKQNVVEKRARQ